jgi:hypothetical protein
MNNVDLDEFSNCDCECECENSENEKCDCDCDCECTAFDQSLFIKKEQLAKIRTHVQGVRFALPSKAGAKKIPTGTPIKVRIPRDQICNNLPNGSLRKTLCEPERMNLKTVAIGTINVCVLVLPGAQVGRVESPSKAPKRVKNEIDAANQIWQQLVNDKYQGVQFNVVSCFVLNKNLPGIGKNAQNFPWNQNEIEKILYEQGKQICPYAHVFVYYMDGNSIGPIYSNGTRTDAITFRNFPVIIISNGAKNKDYILAHELGHFMYTNNLLGYKFDPDPYPGDPDHNAHPTNLMYPTSDFWPTLPQKPTITPAQLRKALNTRFFYD